MYKHALIIGRFQPCHKYHYDMVKKALELSERVTVLVGSVNKNNEENPLAYEARLFLLSKAFPAEYATGHLRIAPMMDDETISDEDWGQHMIERAESLTKKLDKVDLLVFGADYKRNMEWFKESVWESVGMLTLPRYDGLSGTEVRQKFMENREEEVKQNMPRELRKYIPLVGYLIRNREIANTDEYKKKMLEMLMF